MLCRPQPLDPALGAPVGSLLPVVMSYSWCFRRSQLPLTMLALLLVLLPALFLVLPLAPALVPLSASPALGASSARNSWRPCRPQLLVPGCLAVPRQPGTQTQTIDSELEPGERV